MSILTKKRQARAEQKEKFQNAYKRSALLSVTMLALGTAVIAIIALTLFYTLNCRQGTNMTTQRGELVDKYPLIPSDLGGCIGEPEELYTSENMTSYTMLYMLGDGDVKPWQYVGSSPLYLNYHRGGNLIIYLWDGFGNKTEMTLGLDGKFTLKIPAFNYHAWRPENNGPYVILSVITPPGTPDFSQRKLTDISTDPILGQYENETSVKEFSEVKPATYCMMTS